MDSGEVPVGLWPMIRALTCLLLCAAVPAFAKETPPGSRAAQPFDDATYDERLDAIAEKLIATGTFFRPADVETSDKVRSVDAAPVPPATERLAGAELYRRASRSTLMLVAVSQKEWEDGKKAAAEDAAKATPASRRRVVAGRGLRHRTAVGGATAFVVNGDGVVATCRHALEFDGPFVLAAVTASGRYIPVTKILLSDKATDLAFLKIDATDLPALPLLGDISAGEPVRAFGGPSGYYFLMTDGIVSRHSVGDPDEKDPGGPRMPQLDITADIAEGSSGGPVFDLAGNVVGVSQSYAIAENDDHETAFKHRAAIPAGRLLEKMKR